MRLLLPGPKLFKAKLLTRLNKLSTLILLGGHLNPAVTLANVMAGRLPLRKLPIYWSAQILGTFIASAVVFFVNKGKPYSTYSFKTGTRFSFKRVKSLMPI